MVEKDRMESLRNCKKCNRLFSSTNGTSLCSRCSNEVDDGFTRVREYIYDNPSSSVKEVATGTGVDADSILKWIREGRIVLSDRANIAFCERCDTPTDGSRYCGKCVRELSEGLKSGLAEKANGSNQQRHGMHIKENDRKK